MSHAIELLSDPAEMARALALLVSGYPADVRPAYLTILSGLVEQSTAAQDLVVLEARERGKRTGVALGQLLAGRAALVWPVRVVDDATLKLSLLQRLVDELRLRQVVIAQALVEAGDPQPLAEVGFQDGGELLYMVAPEEVLKQETSSEELVFQVVATDDEELAAVIADTYRNSLDFPLVDGWRELADVIAGYRGTGQYRTELWRLVRWRGEAVGCVVLADFPQQSQGELVYLGIRQEFRGRGWGKSIAQWSLNQGGEMGWRQLVLAVDANNQPARRIYESVGFKDLDYRRLYVRQL